VSRTLVVVNPAAAGGRSGRAWPLVRERLARAGVDFEWTATSAPGDGVRLAREGVRSGHGVVVAVGGDGTVNEVVNGVTEDDGTSGAVVAVVLTGRGRDTCRNFGVPARPEAAVDVVAAGGDARFDLGRVAWPDGRRRYFVGACGAGFDAAVARRAARGRATGTLSYLHAVLATVCAFRPQPAAVAADGVALGVRPVTAVVVANGPYFGGGMRIAPDARPGDGVLDLIVLGALGRLELLRWLPGVYAGRHLAHPRVLARRAAMVAIDAPLPLPTHVDGEVAHGTPLTVSVAPAALRLRVPRPG
jgi:YegS/Rv2252/BmrU family lipid kinase